MALALGHFKGLNKKYAFIARVKLPELKIIGPNLKTTSS